MHKYITRTWLVLHTSYGIELVKLFARFIGRSLQGGGQLEMVE